MPPEAGASPSIRCRKFPSCSPTSVHSNRHSPKSRFGIAPISSSLSSPASRPNGPCESSSDSHDRRHPPPSSLISRRHAGALPFLPHRPAVGVLPAFSPPPPPLPPPPPPHLSRPRRRYQTGPPHLSPEADPRRFAASGAPGIPRFASNPGPLD